MTKLRAHAISVSLDGFMAGPEQSLDQPLGVGGERLHTWALATRAFWEQHGRDGGSDEHGQPAPDAAPVDESFVRAGVEGIGATLMGRNMFGPVRGAWASWPGGWDGWWGGEPPYHHPVVVLTHHERPPLTLGDTTFEFVTSGLDAAVARARELAGGQDVRVGGGASVLRALLARRLLDELHLAVVPVLLGGGERLLGADGWSGAAPGYDVVGSVPSSAVLHVRIARC